MTELRVAVFAYEFPAVSETFVLNHIVGLIKQGCDVTILAEQARDESIRHASIQHHDLLRRTIYHRMPKGKFARAVQGLLIGGRLLAARKTVALRALNCFRFGRSAWSLRLLYWVARLDEQGRRFDIVHCHFGPIGELAVRLRDIGALHGMIVTTFHGVDISLTLRNDPSCYRSLFARGDLFLPVSEAWRARLIGHGCDPGRVEVHRMGVELRHLRFTMRRLLPNEPLRLLSVGRLIEKKGMAYGIRAVAMLVEAGRDVEYTIVGDGPDRRALEDLVCSMRLGSRVAFLGWRQSDEVVELMSKHHVLVAPSTTDRNGDMEGIPVTLMEAMATGMPVVSTWHSGIPELVQNGISGLLVDERDVDGLADAIQRLADQAGDWEEMGRAARERIARDYDLAVQNARLVKRYQRLLRERGSGAPSTRPSTTRGQSGDVEITLSARERHHDGAALGTLRDRFPSPQ
jgi:colanic acid/amylovoran biosynthesis glycosyltransferase